MVNLSGHYKKHWLIAALIFAVVFSLAGGLEASGEKIVVGTFSGPPGAPAGWKALRFPRISRYTQYAVVADGGGFSLKAVSRASASALYREVDLDPEEYPVLSWRWKVEGVLAGGDARRKDGDDYAARVYVTFAYDPGKATLVERMKYRLARAIYSVPTPGNAINYIWANRLKKGEAVRNPYTEKAMMIAVESGPGLKGRWIKETRNVYEDYMRVFHERPPRISGVAVMTDSDNTGAAAIGYYDDIVFSRGSEQVPAK